MDRGVEGNTVFG